MKKKTMFWGIAAAPFVAAPFMAMLLALILAVTGCENPVAGPVVPPVDGSGITDSGAVVDAEKVAVQEWRTFDSLSEMGAFLANAAANTAESPYGIRLSAGVSTADFAGLGDESGLTKLFQAFKGKYVALDLSSCVGASVDGGSFDSVKKRPDADKLVLLTLPEGLMSIETQSFKDCVSLVSVTAPEGLQAIGDSAFRGCRSLASINFPRELKSIGQLAFDGTAIRSAELPEGLISIGKMAFATTKSLTSITLPDSLLSIGEYAFQLSSISSAIVGNRVTTLGRGAFQHCKSLQNVTLPSGLTTLGDSMFRDCVSLTSVILPANLQTIGGEAFFGCASLGAINLPQTLTSVSYKVFQGCVNVSFNVAGGGAFTSGENGKVLVKNGQIIAAPSLEGNVTLNGYTSVANYAFRGNTKISAVKFGESFTALGGGLFAQCTNLTAVDVPSTITSLPLGILDAESYAYNSEGPPVPPYGEPPIQTLTLRANVVLPVPYHLNDRVRTVYVPASQVEAYRQAQGWSGCDIQSITD